MAQQAWAQDQGPVPKDVAPSSGEAPCSGSVDGHLVDASSHEPVAGASVRLDEAILSDTDENGHFLLRGLCHGPYTLEVSRADYQLETRSINVDGRIALEIGMTVLVGETFVIQGKTLKPIEMSSTAVVSGEALERTRGRSFSDSLAEVPGVSQLRSASGMSKPIVRGQFGRRLLLLVDGVRLRSQDWGLDHAPEIDPFIADSLMVVRGAAGVRYGPDAIGGAVLVEPPALRDRPGLSGEAHLVGFLGRGGSAAMRLQGVPTDLPRLSWQVEGSAKRLASPVTPDYALDNTGSREWNVGATAGYHLGDDTYKLSYRHYEAKLGVCGCLRIESSDDFFAQLERDMPVDAALYESSLKIRRAYQEVAHDLALARARWPVSLGTVSATYALQYDHRNEFDIVRTATGPQFEFRLTTHDATLGFEHNPIHLSDHHHLRGSVGLVAMAQQHRYGGLTLVPNHDALGTGVFAIERLIGHDFELEAGLRLDVITRTASIIRRDFLRLVRAEQLTEDSCSSIDADPVTCDSTFLTPSASIGGLLQITSPWSVKLELSTASRAPNPDEQYLNGTSPTFPVLGLGKPDLDSETTYSGSATTKYESERVDGEASIYANYISDYIYFAPALNDSGEPIFDVLIRGAFPRFVTRPVDAVFYGVDGGISVKLLPSLDLAAQVSAVRARNISDNSYLVFVPPDRARGTARYTHRAASGLESIQASISGTYVARQRRFDLAADLAPPPDGYFLVDAEVGGETRIANQTLKVALQGTNLLNTRYRDYTSLLRYFADQPGWQAMLRLSVTFSTPTP